MEDFKGSIVIYTVVGCPHCLATKSKLKELKLPFTDVRVDKHPAEVREWLKKRTSKTSVPQIFINGRYIGGNSEFQTLVNDKAAFKEILSTTTDDEEDVFIPISNENDNEMKMSPFSCEVDEYSALVTELLNSGIVKYHRKGLFSGVKDSFSGSDFLDWLEKNKGVSRTAGIEMGQQLISRKFGLAIDDDEEPFRDSPDALYRLQTDQHGALNVGISQCAQRPASQVSEDIRKTITEIYSQHLSEDGTRVNYKSIKTSPAFDNFKTLTEELPRVDIGSLNRDESTAFFINVYNSLVIHGNVERGTPTSLWQRYKFFSTVGYNISGYFYSLNDIENGVLRGNRGSMATLYRTPFGSSDPRIAISFDDVDPRIHFALNCGAKSCPPIKTFSGSEVRDQLRTATEAYLENDDAIKIETTEDSYTIIQLSMLFKWYSVDFGRNKEEILQWIVDNIGDHNPKKRQIATAIESRQYKVKYIPYDWGHNST